MPKRNRFPNRRRLKIHRSYTVEEAAVVLGVHKNTVRTWVKGGLPVCDQRRPTLILGRTLIEYLRIRMERRKQRCQPGELYCVRCRIPKTPAGNMVECQQTTGTIGNLVAICPDCNSIMNRRVNLSRLEDAIGKMDLTFSKQGDA